MKKNILLFIYLLCQTSIILSNPIIRDPMARFSELVFNDNNNWTMELSFELLYFFSPATDSIILKVSNIEAKVKVSFTEGTYLGIITPDSLSVPLIINRYGDKIEIYTYINSDSVKTIYKDSLIFGNYPGATVGQPISGYSIMRNTFEDCQNELTVDCLTKVPSIGSLNELKGLTSTLQGHIYDVNNNPVTKLKIFPASACYFELETSLTIYQDGTYTTKIFHLFDTEIKNSLIVKMWDFEWFKDTTEIEPFELKDIHPDTLYTQDIHLKSNEYVVTSVENDKASLDKEFELINYPNPFNSSTNFFVKIPDKLKDKPGNIEIYNLNGQQIKTIAIKGSSTVHWDGTDMNGRTLPSGIYYYRLNFDNQVMKNGSMILLK